MRISGRIQQAAALVALAAVCGSMGCQNNTQTGAAVGAGAGSLAGAIIGHQSGNRDLGALIGGVTGALGGAAIGRNQDLEEERDAAMRHASHVEASRRADNFALTNSDVINMSQNRVGDEIIVQAIHKRGGRFRTNSEAIISLRQAGVSEYVIGQMLNYSSY